jgi:hypothetical protein
MWKNTSSFRTSPLHTHKEKENRQALIYGMGYVNPGATPVFQVRVIQFSASLHYLFLVFRFVVSGFWLPCTFQKSLTLITSVHFSLFLLLEVLKASCWGVHCFSQDDCQKRRMNSCLTS